MKKIIIAMMALAATSASMAKTADELRVYINPGHGSWTPNDRPNPLVGHGEYSRTNTDTTNFFESNTNLRKGFGVLEKLRVYGLKYDPTLNQTGDRHQIGAARDMSNNIVMSHVKCGPYHDDNGTKNQLGDATPADIEYYNRNLSEICAEVEANHFDMFISIHSNAATEGTSTNYPLFLYRGYDTPKEETGVTLEHQSTSRAMADACWGYAYENPHMMWTAYSDKNKNLRGDINFYGSGSTSSLGYKGYLGVLKNGAPGFLVEGYFHTYQVARHRAMNWDVDYMEGAAYAHGIADYFGLTKESTGDIYGIVRDANERFTDKYFKPNTATLDRFMPLNGCTAILNKDGKEVARYTTDNYYNGAFVFKDVEPGTYTLTFEAEGYNACEPVEVEVKAASISYPTAQLVSSSWVPPTIVYENYPDPMASNASVLPAAEYLTAADYVDEAIAGLEGKIIRRAIVRNGKMYILAFDKELEFAAVVPEADQVKATIIVYDLAKKEILSTVSTKGAAGSIAAIGDIQVTADGFLLACNATKTQYNDADGIQAGDAGRGTFHIYKWVNDEAGVPSGDPTEWLKTQYTGNWFRAYPTRFAYTGTTANGSAVILMPTITGPTYNMRTQDISVIDGAQQSDTYHSTPSGQYVAMGDLDASMNIVISPNDELDALIIDPNAGMIKWGISNNLTNSDYVKNEIFKGIDGRAGIFRYAGTSYVVAPAGDGTNITGLQLVNLNKNFEDATAATVTIPAEVAPVATAQAAAAAEVEVTRDETTDAVTGGWINFYLLRDGKISKFTTKNVAQPQGRREYAYGLATKDLGQGATEITFNMTGDAPEATLVLTPNKEDAQAVIIPLGAVVKGENTHTVAAGDIDQLCNYTWEIKVVSEPIAQAGLVSADPSGLTVRGGVIPITDPEYPETFGYVAVGHGANKGVDIYNPEGVKVTTRAYVNHKLLGGETTNQSNPFRGNELRGQAVFSTWGDTGYGMVAVNPIDTDAEPVCLFAGDKMGGGHFIYNGVNLGGGNAGFDFVGEGENTYVISFSEDHEGSNGKGATENSLVKYHLGEGWLITEAPEVIGYKSFLANTNVDVLTWGNGVFVSQVRGAGNNQSSVPCFAYISDIIDNDDIAMTSADDNLVDHVDNNTSGIAITVDGKTFAAAMAGKIAIFDVEWKDGKPEMTFAYSFNIDANTWSNLRFDAAGNLHAYLREGGYRVYSLPALRPEATTAAPAALIIYGTESGVREITAEDAAAADAVFYNLQGVRVDASNITPGVYVKVAGTTATKVLVK